jgi:hypothetical protein
MVARRGASFRYVVTSQFFAILPPFCCFCARTSLKWLSPVFVCWRQELEIRAQDRYDALDQMSSELHRLQEQRDALDALVVALRTSDEWLAYRAEALRDHHLELEGQSTEGASTVEKVRMTLIDRDEALQRAREDLAGARTVAVEWEAEVASVRAQLQRDRATLEKARSWQGQAEERAREAEELKASLADKAAAVVAAEEQLRQERAARQEAESQLQQERAAHIEARAALERERLAREEALGQLQQERAALEGARASLKEQEDDVSKLDGELIVLSISHEDQRRSLAEQGGTVVSLQQAVEGGRQALEAEKKQVEGESLFVSCFVDLPFGDSLPTWFFLFVAFRPADRSGARDHSGRGCAGGLQLLVARVGRAAGRRPRDLPCGRRRRGASRELAGESPVCPRWACLPAHALRPSPGRPEGPRRGGVPLSGGLRGRGVGLRRPCRC